MPYTYKKEGDRYCIYKKDSGKKVGCTGGDKESLKKYLAALHMNTTESIDIKNIHFKVNADKTIDFIDSTNNLLGTLDLYGGFETESEEACQALVTLFEKYFKFKVKLEKTINGSPNILLTKKDIMKLLQIIKGHQNSKITEGMSPITNENMNTSINETFNVGDSVEALVGKGKIIKGKYAGKKLDVDGRLTHAIKNPNGEITLHPKIYKTIKEITQSGKTTQQIAIDTQITKLQTQIAALQKKKEQLSKQSTTDEGISLSKLVKKIKEADTEDAPEKDAPEKEAPDTGNDAQDSANDDSQPKGLSIKFNMANVKKYNNYPVVDNTGTVTGVSKEGIAVLCGDNTVFVNFEDILNESKKIRRLKEPKLNGAKVMK